MQLASPGENTALISDLFAAPQDKCWRQLLGLDGLFAMAMVRLDILGAQMAAAGGDEFARRVLTAGEVDHYLTLTYPKRKMEWFGGRLAAKYAAMKVRPASKQWQDWAVLPDHEGRPLLYSLGHGQARQEPPALSISHSGGYAAALAADCHCCGLDLQKVTPTVLKVWPRYCLAGEREVLEKALGGLAPVLPLTVLWAAKEALKKAFAVGFTETRMIGGDKTAAEGQNNFWILDFLDQKHRMAKVKVGVTFDDEFVLAFAVGSRDNRRKG